MACFCLFRILEKVKMCVVEVGCTAEAAEVHKMKWHRKAGQIGVDRD